MKQLHSWTAACLVVAVMFLMSISVQPAMAAEMINREFDRQNTAASTAGLLSATQSGHKQLTVKIREVDIGGKTMSASAGALQSLTTASGARTYRNGPITLVIRDPLAEPVKAAAVTTADAGAAGSSVAGAPVDDNELAAEFANMTSRGFKLTSEDTHRYESRVTSPDFLAVDASGKALIEKEGFRFDTTDTVRSYRDVAYYRFINTATGKKVIIMTLQKIDTAGNPIGKRVIAVGPEYTSATASMASLPAAGGLMGATDRACWQDGCVSQWIAIVATCVLLVLDLALLILECIPGAHDRFAEYMIQEINILLFKLTKIPAGDPRVWMEAISKFKSVLIIGEIVIGIVLLIVLAYSIYDLGVCACWWSPISFSGGDNPFIWDYQYKFTDEDNGKTVTLDLHDRIAVALAVDTRTDPGAHWVLASAGSFVQKDTATADIDNLTYQAFLLQADTPGNASLTFHYETSKPLPSAISTATYKLNVAVNPAKWTIETVDSTADAKGTGMYTSLVFGKDGTPHISYYAPCAGGVRYATLTASGWETETVSGSRGTYRTSIAIDPQNGRPAFTFSDTDSSGDLYYAYWDGTKWNKEVIQHGSTWAPGKYSSLRFDPAGVPHVAYSSTMAYSNLMYATRQKENTWALEKVDTAGPVGDTGYDPSLVFNASGYPFIAYRTGGDHANLMFAEKNSNGGWAITTVDDAQNWGNTGITPSLALDSHGNPHISYDNANTHDKSNNGLRYAYRNSTRMWNLVTVTGIDNVGQWTSLVLDTSDRPIVAFYDARSGYLKYATRYSREGPWVTRTIDIDGNVGACTSVALDPSGNPAISYLDYTHHALRYAVMQR